MSKPTICLSMIVRDEAHIITRCLDSVKPYIDRWIICDTGSLDDTCVNVRAYFKAAGIPGKLLHHKWVDFGHNRTLALQEAAKTGCDYILVIDADEVLVVDNSECLQTLQDDAYRVEMRFPDVSYPRVNLMRSARNWRYVGVIHEYATCDPPAPEYLLDPAAIHMWTDGAGARGKSSTKLQRDVVVMEQWVKDEPDNPRAWFYLAQGYETIGKPMEAMQTYKKRSEMADFMDEVWFSHYRMGHICAGARQWNPAIVHYLNAYNCQPSRAESLYFLAQLFFNRQMDAVALLYAEPACQIDKPVSALFLEPSVYDYQRFILLAILLHNTGQKDDAIDLAQRVIAAGKAPEAMLPTLQRIIGDVSPVQLEAASV